MNYTNPAEQEIIGNLESYARSIDGIIRTFENGGRFFNFKQFELLENTKYYLNSIADFHMDIQIKSYGDYLNGIINRIQTESMFSR